MVAQALLLLGPLDPLGVFQKLVERAEFLEKCRRVARADAGYSGDVVDRVAGERQVIDDLIGADPPFLLENNRVDHFLGPQIEHPDLVADQLPRILVAGDDKDVEPSLLAPAGEGRDHVVGLHHRFDQHWDPKALENPPDDRDLGNQVDGHLFAGTLVRREYFFAKHWAGPVERRRQVVGLDGFHDAQQVTKDPKNGLGRLTGRPGHLRNGVVDLKDQGVCVENIKGRARRHAIRFLGAADLTGVVWVLTIESIRWILLKAMTSTIASQMIFVVGLVVPLECDILSTNRRVA